MKNKHSQIITRREFLKKTITGCAALGLTSIGVPAFAVSKPLIRIGYLPILDHMILMISHARDNDGFKHIHIEPKMFKRWSAIAGALKAGVIDGAFLLSNFAMNQFSQGVEIKSVILAHRNGSGITVAKDSSIHSPADLKGKKIGVPDKISTHMVLLDKYLRRSNLSLNDVVIREIAPPHMVYALTLGRIDAFIVAEPFCAKAEIEGVGKTLELSKDIFYNHICCTVVVRNQVLKTNPEGIQEWVTSLNQSGAFIDQDKADNIGKETARIAARYMKHNEQTIINGMINPADRITYTDLNPKIEDYQAILISSQDAGIIGDVDLNAFVDDSFYINIA